MTTVAEQLLTRAKLAAPYRINAAYGGQLAGAYAHARSAAAQGVALDKSEDAHAEIDRIGAMYARLRRFVSFTVRSAGYQPGQIVTVRYPRYGLDAGVNGFIVSVTVDVTARTSKLIIWI